MSLKDVYEGEYLLERFLKGVDLWWCVNFYGLFVVIFVWDLL